MSEREAQCSCGQLRVATRGDPIRVSVCHCFACQRRTGSAFGTQARFARADVAIFGRASEYVRYSDEDGEPRTYRFCPDCGATVWFTLGTDSDTVAVPVGAFADPRFPAPVRQIFEDRAHPRGDGYGRMTAVPSKAPARRSASACSACSSA
jgi:hypothetical protein